MAEDLHLGIDIRLSLRNHELRPVYIVSTARRRIPQQDGFLEDMDLIAGRENLGQAVIIRLLTPRGELAPLAHPTYGSRLHELIGRRNTETTRNLVKLYILESLAAEPRIEKILNITVEPAQGTRDTVIVRITVKPVESFQPLAIGPFALELSQ